ncbi:uncharacterized protein A1O9_11309 [Exophiala aquamarina CBS 119918]|uniref:Fumarylacetoacetase-like C-terminal domain-containing protein n=1 Tax=Exophiala aquamarina CBS 119918 TaxID=1182545 RepID=A0A072NYH7_9EURO|nr:uncharacterized protein A1O9_11309 [Exophiala aquamarina CBS 119918]KEF52467.1 hypothetical protein A1O9_11309 [Exophiala aquamarina CBS 119918]
MGYEGEFVVVIARDAKNVSRKHAPSCALGFTVGDDVTARNFSSPDTAGRSYDGFTPIVIMTGTSKGVGMFTDPQALLKHGDIVEIDLQGSGKSANRFAFK